LFHTASQLIPATSSYSVTRAAIHWKLSIADNPLHQFNGVWKLDRTRSEINSLIGYFIPQQVDWGSQRTPPHQLSTYYGCIWCDSVQPFLQSRYTVCSLLGSSCSHAQETIPLLSVRVLPLPLYDPFCHGTTWQCSILYIT